MSETWYPQAVRLPITTQEFTKVRYTPVTSICQHITAGTDSRDWLQHADNSSSVTFLLRLEGDKVVTYQFMPIEWAAWGNGRFSRNNPNNPKWIRDFINSQPDTDEGRARVSRFLLSSTISVEHEGVAPTAALYTGPMLEATIALDKWLMSVVPTIKADREHIIGHYQIDHINRAFCPGGPGGKLFPFDTVIAALKSPIIPPAFAVITESAFQAFWLGLGDRALELFGTPLERSKQEKLGDGNTYTVQYFERARFELHGDKVLLGLLGVEVLGS